ncbi:MAG: hypothetical protein IKS31_09795 [Clostridia bacterium]|nr:hypothetical protein [Clostridia bacterium]
MLLTVMDDFSPEKIHASGQCFRWEQTGPDAWRILHAGHCVRLRAQGDGVFSFSCGEEEFRSVWAPYLDLEEEYAAIRRRIDPQTDPFLWAAAESERGIRILRQDFWETLVTFIISQNRNIPAIRRSVELLCALCGEARTDDSGEPYRTFPPPESVAALSDEALNSCKLGYRAAYVRAAAEAVASERIRGEDLRSADCEEAVQTLMQIRGVGRKVASCVALFGLHQLDAFPRDVWISRVLEEAYPDGYPFGRYSPYNGVCQQYLFAYRRHLEAPSA